MPREKRKIKYEIDAEDKDRLDKNFRYHRPYVDQPLRYAEIQEKAKDLTQVIMENVPKKYERNLAIESVKVAVFWAIEGIDRNEMPL